MPSDKFLEHSLAIECPELCLDWHPTKNLPLTIYNVSYGSGKVVWWQCNICQYEWKCHISNRRKQYHYPGEKGTKCPNCIDRVFNADNCFAKTNPELVNEWHPTKNMPDTPYTIAKAAIKKFYWICSICNNEWQSSAANRSCGAGCPLCGKNKNRNNKRAQ